MMETFLRCGNVTYRNRWNLLAPSISAASYNSALIDWSTPVDSKNIYALPNHACIHINVTLITNGSFFIENFAPKIPFSAFTTVPPSDLLISYIFKLTMNNQYQAIGATITVIISIALMIIAYIGYRNTDAFKRG